jgi:D-proline reductase (dithiol) PrdB
MTDREDVFSFAPEDDVPIPYRQRIRDYYQALGYGAPYRWAHYAEVPFTPLEKPLAESRIALVTTAAPHQPGKGDQGPGAPYNAAPKFYTVYSGDSAIAPDLRISHIAYDRDHTTAEDSNTWFPLRQLRRAAAPGNSGGRIAEVAPRFHGLPTNRSHRATIGRDCPELLARLHVDRVDAVILAAV